MSVQHSPSKNLSGSAPNLSVENMAKVTWEEKDKYCDNVYESRAILNEMHKFIIVLKANKIQNLFSWFSAWIITTKPGNTKIHCFFFQNSTIHC